MVPNSFRRSRVLSCVYAKLPPKVKVCFPEVQMALAEGLKRFWNIPVKAPCCPPGPILIVYGYDGKTAPAQTTLIPGKTGEPNVLTNVSAGVIAEDVIADATSGRVCAKAD